MPNLGSTGLQGTGATLAGNLGLPAHSLGGLLSHSRAPLLPLRPLQLRVLLHATGGGCSLEAAQ
jgi:hypothetical protein